MGRMEIHRWLVIAASLATAACGSSKSSGSSPGDGGTGSSDGSSHDAGGAGNDATSDGNPGSGMDAGDGGHPGSGNDAGDGGNPGSGNDAGDAGSPGDSGGGGGEAGTLLACTNMAATTTGDAGTATGVVSGMVPGPGTFVGGCQIFPADNAWNVDVSSPSITTTAIYTGLPTSTRLHPDLGGWSTGGGPYGIPFNVVPDGQPDVSITFNQYGSESDPGPGGWTVNPGTGGTTGVTAYPIPNGAKIEGAPPQGQTPGDDHLLVVHQGATCGAPCTLWETWATVGGSAPPWTAANGAMWNLGSNGLRPLGWTSADAAGLSVFAGLLKIAEVKAGVVTHAIRVTFNNTQMGYVYPATHYAGSSALGGSDPPMGLRLRMKSTVVTSGFSAPGKVVATAMQTYGLIVADIGSDWYFQGDSDDGWNAQDVTDTYIGELITDFEGVTGADFEVLYTGDPVNTGE
jgi:hypothetical protein